MENIIKNYRGIELNYFGATNTQGARIKLKDLYVSNETITLNRNYETEATEQATAYLLNLGFNIIGRINTKEKTIFIISDFTKSIKTGKELKY
jgi:hypothetical protein